MSWLATRSGSNFTSINSPNRSVFAAFLWASFSPELADLTLYVIDVFAGDKIRARAALASFIGASLEVMQRDARKMRGERPFVFTNLKVGDGVDRIAQFVIIGGRLDAH